MEIVPLNQTEKSNLEPVEDELYGRLWAVINEMSDERDGHIKLVTVLGIFEMIKSDLLDATKG